MLSYLIHLNCFEDFFNSVLIASKPMEYSQFISNTNSNIPIPPCQITAEDVLINLKESKDSFTMGIDGIPFFLPKDCAQILAEPLCIIFNLIIKKSVFPSLWKKGYICPIFKKGQQNQVTNYRGISILCNFAKVFESILYYHIYSSTKLLISSSQHGFVQKKSTITNLAVFSQYISEVIDGNGQCDVIYTDVEKAFDKIEQFCNISFTNLSLTGRISFVKYSNFRFKPILLGYHKDQT